MFLNQISVGVMAKSWGNATIFEEDRLPMFDNG